MTSPLLALRHISKSFPGVQALTDVGFDVHAGEIVALLGENGAGKSTLMKILNGVQRADSGEIIWQGKTVTLNTPRQAQDIGIAMIHQELALIPYLDSAKNIFLGREPQGALPNSLNWQRLYAQTETLLTELGLTLDPRKPVRFFSTAQQQMIEVAKALSRSAKLIIMDEPTSSLADREVEMLFHQMRALKARGVAIIFITHRLEEVFAVCDRVVVLRDGAFVATQPVSQLTKADIIRMMVGRDVTQIYEKTHDHQPGKILLEARHLTRTGSIQSVNLTLRAGEILGVAGLVGSGRTELADTLFGAEKATSGEILIEGKSVAIHHPTQAIQHGIAYVTEDRKRSGVFLGMSVAENTMIAYLRQMAHWLIQWRKVNTATQEYVSRFAIRTPSTTQLVRNLSGGNQQKVVIAKWLTLAPKVLILDEPTRGIDVGAKSEIYKLMHELASHGMGILMISSELPEVLGVSDRVIVMHEGRITGEFDPRTATQEDIMVSATGTTA